MPTESKYPAYSLPDYWPAYCKFLMYGGQKDATINPNMRIFNKVGDAYGFCWTMPISLILKKESSLCCRQ